MDKCGHWHIWLAEFTICLLIRIIAIEIGHFMLMCRHPGSLAVLMLALVMPRIPISMVSGFRPLVVEVHLHSG